MKVGVARESAAGERRVALVPEALGKLTAAEAREDADRVRVADGLRQERALVDVAERRLEQVPAERVQQQSADRRPHRDDQPST